MYAIQQNPQQKKIFALVSKFGSKFLLISKIIVVVLQLNRDISISIIEFTLYVL